MIGDQTGTGRRLPPNTPCLIHPPCDANACRFVTGSFDRFMRLWDTETGQCISTFTNRKVPYCVKFYPVDNNLFVMGSSDNKVVQWDTTSGK